MSDLLRGPQDQVSPEQKFHAITAELEERLLALVTQPLPPVEGFRLLQHGVMFEIMPHIFVQIVHQTHDAQEDRFVRLWYRDVSVEDAEDMDLLCFYTDEFPDALYTEISRLGMNMNLNWWQVVRQRLIEVEEQIQAQRALPPPDERDGRDLRAVRGDGAGRLLSGGPAHRSAQQTTGVQAALHGRAHAETPALPAGTGPLATPRGRSTAGPPFTLTTTTTGAAIPTTGASAAQPPAAPPKATALEVRQYELLARQMGDLFGHFEQERQAAYAQRDALERTLREQYFVAFPVMQLAARQVSEEHLRASVQAWVERGFPAPDDTALPPGLLQVGAEERARQLEDATRRAREATLELERVRVRVHERTRSLQKVCELAERHEPREERDEDGAARTVCARCGAALSSRAPAKADTWVN